MWQSTRPPDEEAGSRSLPNSDSKAARPGQGCQILRVLPISSHQLNYSTGKVKKTGRVVGFSSISRSGVLWDEAS
jgi:hypothetical protein